MKKWTKRYPHICPVCSKHFISGDPRQLYCTKECAQAWRNQPLVSYYRELGISPGTVGAIAELIVAVDLMKKGYHVFRSMSPSCPYDLITFRGEEIKRLEVKTAYKTLSGKLYHPKLRNQTFDHLALVVGTEITYMPALAEEVNTQQEQTSPQL